MEVNVAVGQHACYALQWGSTRRYTAMTPTTVAVGVECLGKSNYQACTTGGREISNYVTSGIQMVMVASVVVVLLASFVPKPTAGHPTTEMTLTIEEEDVV